jgi:hypothetical protein
VQPRPKHNHGHGCRPRHGLELRAIALHASELRLWFCCAFGVQVFLFFSAQTFIHFWKFRKNTTGKLNTTRRRRITFVEFEGPQ